MRALRYFLWAATIFVVCWALTIISCIVGSKGLAKSERGVIDQ